MLQETDIRTHLHSGGSDDPERVQDDRINKPGIGLAGYRHAAVKSHLFRDHGIQAVHLVEVSVEEFKEGGLRSGRSLAAEELQAGKDMFDFAERQIEFLHPESRSLSHCRGLRGLEVGKAQRRKTLVGVRELGKLCQNIDQFPAYQAERFAHDDHIGIISHVAACRAEMDDALRLGALQSICIDMAHNVVADDLLTRLRFRIVDIIGVFLELRDLLIRDRKSQLLLCLCQRDPQFSPRSELHVGREDILHLSACVSLGKRAHISVICHAVFLSVWQRLPSARVRRRRFAI